ncbi:MAG: sigma-54 dependent transcriptional regulator [Acidobacteriota bacterium]|nr:sigma-54 dependent transcriptional regulator [Acidobacteriota bacterium]
MRRIFLDEGFQIAEAATGQAGMDLAGEQRPDVVLLDLHVTDFDGFDVLERLKGIVPGVPIIVLSGSRDVKSAVRATQLGAFDYQTKPFDRDELVIAVRRATETRALRIEVEALRRQVRIPAGGLLLSQLGPSDEAAGVIAEVNRVAASNYTVLILGETGTGKELVAQAIHQASDRARKPFIALDCGAIPELLLESELFGHERGAFTGAEQRKLGRFRLAEGGTCFLDEVGNLPTNLQAKLLRALESKQVQAVGADRPQSMDVRFLAATNDDLQARVSQGLFRADLYFRLAQYTIALPPLRERPTDIPYLAQRFADEASVELRRPVETILPDAFTRLRQYGWPGNVRELRNVVRQAVLHAEGFAIRGEDIRFAAERSLAHAGMAVSGGGGQSLREIAAAAVAGAERRAITDTLAAHSGNKSKTARTLQTDYKTLHLKMKRLGIRGGDFRH